MYIKVPLLTWLPPNWFSQLSFWLICIFSVTGLLNCLVLIMAASDEVQKSAEFVRLLPRRAQFQLTATNHVAQLYMLGDLPHPRRFLQLESEFEDSLLKWSKENDKVLGCFARQVDDPMEDVFLQDDQEQYNTTISDLRLKFDVGRKKLESAGILKDQVHIDDPEGLSTIVDSLNLLTTS